ncbi:tRNA (adenosine(37)-N6)-threonylcarbamoyltransferase complex ATPase subunit type 1 TsaE [Fulvivirgaceae bacterium BMA10]|uniref:tRNA threonylcarbamoyladenosine biosynthesis protein TsaE n=1 Tax=Splendidivirga corallicola TaxID=3051826 RepID=A0ABT8KSY3_9BACT|nr:tRNA (adenosine(37)-N6)-threonylcarbamoyltransferase complex ATPase subunit type 1 TsaE [Fulvivirgaceae bacterium BMA10]
MQVNTGFEKELTCEHLEFLPRLAEDIVEFAGDNRIWLFEGEMGAGKTTLIKAVCDVFQVEDNVSSPTFSIVNEYLNNSGETFYHFDFYRLKDEKEAMDIGCDEYFESGNICFIEWPSRISSILPSNFCQIEIISDQNGKRIIKLKKHEGSI